MTERHVQLTNRELQAQLKRQRVPLAEQIAILTDAQVRRRQRASEAAFIRIHRDAWRSILTPLRQEWNNARTSAAYDPNDSERVEAFLAYAEVLEHTRLRLLGRMLTRRSVPMTFDEYTGNQSTIGEKVVADASSPHGSRNILSTAVMQDLRAAYEATKPVKQRPYTPSELARHMCERYHRDNKGFPVPNHGVHWTDWVSPAQRRYVTEMFEALADRKEKRKHARIKEPFKRVDTPDKFDAKRSRLRAMAEKDLERLTRQHMVTLQSYLVRKAVFEEDGGVLEENPKDIHLRLAARKERAARAYHLLGRWTRDDGALPRTWHGVLKD
jgi:hypothetical protein